MRRTDREITNFNEIIDILNRAATLRLGIQGEEYPYVVPLCFGVKVEKEQVTIYAHGAKDGLKSTLLARNNNVCIEADIFHKYLQTERGFTALYESVIGFGTAETVTGSEAEAGMDSILTHCGFQNAPYDKSALEKITILKITLTKLTGKRHTI